jgi:TMEM175 potassium channel family protein
MTTSRLEAFSDGVFAIAITLLALELPRPTGPHLGHELATQWEAYAAFVVSFLTIGIIWVNHHTLLDRIAHADRGLLFLNLLMLMLFYVAALALAFVAPAASLALNFAIALYYLRPDRAAALA